MRLRDFLLLPADDWRRQRQEQRRPQAPAPVYEPEPEPTVVGDLTPLSPEELLPPEERGFVVGPSLDDPYLQKLYDFGYADEYGNITDEYAASLLWQGWYGFMDMPFDDLAYTRDAFFDYTGLSWQDFDDWREYISDYLGAA